jgi:hypothetical protein
MIKCPLYRKKRLTSNITKKIPVNQNNAPKCMHNDGTQLKKNNRLYQK